MSENQHVAEHSTDLKRNMKSRHLSMIAIGGAIGTGLWFASGQVVSTVGPGGALLDYALMGALVYLLMTGLGEMATKVPLSGSFESYAHKFIDPAAGFAIGWNYYLSWAVTVTFEIVVGAISLEYWFPPSVLPAWIPRLVFFALLFFLNFASAKVFGESEFWFAGLKVVVVIIFLIVGVCLMFGIIGNHPSTTEGGIFGNWVHEATQGALKGHSAPFPVGVGALITMFLIAAFSFQGTELIGLSAGEAENPEKSIPKAINSVFWRIILFYIGSMIVIGTLVPFDNTFLMQTNNVSSDAIGAVAYSPFTLVFEIAGLHWAANLMNFVFMTSVLSCGNSGLFCATRMLYGMANEHKAPKILGRTNKRGVPVYALYVTAAIAGVGFFLGLIKGFNVYEFLIDASGMMGMIGWIAIAWGHLYFRRAYKAQGMEVKDLVYKAKFFPVGAIIALILSIIVVLASNWTVFTDGSSFGVMLYWYWPVLTFAGCFFIYKFVMKTHFIKPLEADFSTNYVPWKRPTK